MAHAPSAPHSAEMSTPHPPLGQPTVQAMPVTPGKVAMWLFLATEIMFFTGLIGSYVVLRAGSPPTAYSNLFQPNTPLAGLENSKGVRILSTGADAHRVAELFVETCGYPVAPSESDAAFKKRMEELVEEGSAITRGRNPADAEALASRFRSLGATIEVVGLKTDNWPQPYDHLTNPLSIDLTAMNTFFLICSSVTMVLALSGVQQGNQRKLIFYLAATVLIGSVFVGIQFIEYRKLMFADAHPIGIGKDGHFRPASSLFGSCFFTMTGFHGAHVTGGVILLACILVGAIRGKFTATNHSAVELAGLYWHFVDLVWIILFTVVYLI